MISQWRIERLHKVWLGTIISISRLFTVCYCDMSKKRAGTLYMVISLVTPFLPSSSKYVHYFNKLTKLCIILLRYHCLFYQNWFGTFLIRYSCIHFHSKSPTFTVLTLCHTYAVSLYTYKYGQYSIICIIHNHVTM